MIIGHEEVSLEDSMNSLNVGEGQDFIASPYQASSIKSQCPELSSTPGDSPQGLDYDDSYTASPVGPYSSGYAESEFLKGQPVGLHSNSYSDYDHMTTTWTKFRPGVVGQERTQTPLSRGRVGPLVHQHQSQAHVRSSTYHNDYASGHHNTVEVERIRQGVDVRTTVRR